MTVKNASETSSLNGKGKRFCIVASRYHDEIVDALVASALATLKAHEAEIVDIVRVPGAFEIPFIVRRRAVSRRYDAIITLGCVIRGETDHYDLIIATYSRSIAQIILQTDVPITLGILAADNIAQAKARAQPDSDTNRGKENALTALEMAQFDFLGRNKQ